MLVVRRLVLLPLVIHGFRPPPPAAAAYARRRAMTTAAASNDVSLLALADAGLRLAVGAGAIIRGVAGPGTAAVGDVVYKGDDTPQTVADRRAQRYIVRGLAARFPGVAIVGEEGDLGTGSDDDDAAPPALADLGPPAGVAAAWAAAPGDADAVAASRVAVWIDPLDGTREFTEGRYEYVTTLVGVCVDGRPVLGVVVAPYGPAGDGAWRALWGGTAAGGVFQVSRDSAPAHAAVPPPPPDDASSADGALAVVSRSRFAGPVAQVVGALERQGVLRGHVAVGGAGCKSASVVLGDADVWAFPQAGTCRWDVCASEALLVQLGGALTDRTGAAIEYDPDADDYTNTGGVLACRTAALHGRCLPEMEAWGAGDK